ncbi:MULTISPECIES: lysis system i-spanin subunit Rz [Pseudomonas]|uniref:lysis system i-spanin subunit Rz n=1 Tax=Pseudomonas TaxID=286 RepID=UPI000B35FB37|nr:MULTISPECIES: lysis system i-spanin subunit Rz [Pseudomonas]PMY71030.1 DNA primase [Pseudomonas sp. FW305-25]PMY75559.1 DNA primase [Pseudomonas sp. FW126-L8]PNA81419.1 DNA primase [Pseudomonas sp. FW305-76]
MTPVQKLFGVLVLASLLIAAGAGRAWRVQDWRYGKQLADLARRHQDDLSSITNAASAQQQAEQAKRLTLEQRLATADQFHHQELTNAQKDQARLHDRLATADLRLSVLVDAADTASCSNVPATPTTGGVVHGAARARLDPAHAQRIVSITDAGDQGLIALRACQAYVKKITTL